MNFTDIEGKDGVLTIAVNLKANPKVEEAVATFLNSLAAAIKRFSAHATMEPEK